MTPDEAVIRFERYLRNHNLCVTDERRYIVRASFESHEHFTADDLLQSIQAEDLSVSRASVYRTLSLLVDAGLVRKVDFGTGISCYEHMHGDDHHDHMICTECGKVFEFNEPEIEHLQDRVCQQWGFSPQRHSLKIFGRCHDCSQTRR